MRRLTPILLAAACSAVCGCSDPDPVSETPGRESPGVEREIRGFEMTQTHRGVLSWRLRSESAWRIPNDPRITLEDVHLEFFDAEGEVQSTLTARTGTADEETGALTAREQVEVISTEGDTLHTEELIYSTETDLIHGPDFVRLAKPDRVLTGYGFEAEPDLSDYKVLRDVNITIIDRPTDAAVDRP